MAKLGVLLVQVGTPDAPTPSAVRRFLREFLTDRRVVDLPRWLWLPILYGPVLWFRPRRSAALYRKIWMEEGSPLLVYTKRLGNEVQAQLGDEAHVQIAMRYGEPSIAAAVSRLRDAEVEEVLIVPLFPQYSGATTGSVYDAIDLVFTSDRPRQRRVRSFATAPLYIQGVTARARRFVEELGQPERWLLSFHGIPQRQVRNGDPYEKECRATADAIAAEMGWSGDEWELSFQSRLGPEAWLAPYTDVRFKELGKQQLTSLTVICPGFAADCLETIDEIGELGSMQFRDAGGGQLRLVPCLNGDPSLAELIARLARGETNLGVDMLSS